jgi:predicted alpha/beta-hydrolase family hydrolase
MSRLRGPASVHANDSAMPDAQELKFLATEEKGEVSALLIRPDRATHLLVLGHGASSNMRTPLLTRLAEHLANFRIATFRYNFPYSENGTGRNSNSTCTATIRSAVAAAHKAASDLTLLAGGHSFSGRMTSHAQAERPLDNVKGIVFFSFPLHPAGRPGTERAEHLKQIKIPMLFLGGTRDDLGHLDLLEPVVTDLGKRTTLHLLDTADHSFKVQTTKRENKEDVFDEAASAVRDWASRL